MLRESGTHLVYADWHDIEHRAPDYPGMICRAFDASTCLWFWWDGRVLRQLRDADEARELLFKAMRRAELETRGPVWACGDCGQLSNRPDACEECGAPGSSRRLED